MPFLCSVAGQSGAPDVPADLGQTGRVAGRRIDKAGSWASHSSFTRSHTGAYHALQTRAAFEHDFARLHGTDESPLTGDAEA